MTIESDGVTTEVIREYEPNKTDEPALPAVTRAVALAAAITHYPKEN